MLAQTLKSGPEATKPGNERFVKGFPSKSSQSTMLAQTLKSGLTMAFRKTNISLRKSIVLKQSF